MHKFLLFSHIFFDFHRFSLIFFHFHSFRHIIFHFHSLSPTKNIHNLHIFNHFPFSLVYTSAPNFPRSLRGNIAKKQTKKTIQSNPTTPRQFIPKSIHPQVKPSPTKMSSFLNPSSSSSTLNGGVGGAGGDGGVYTGQSSRGIRLTTPGKRDIQYKYIVTVADFRPS